MAKAPKSCGQPETTLASFKDCRWEALPYAVIYAGILCGDATLGSGSLHSNELAFSQVKAFGG